MLEDLKLLVELQEIDTKIHEIEKEKERQPRLVALAGEQVREVETGLQGAQADLDAVNKEKRTLEGELQTENEHLRKLKLRSSEIKNNKEYFAHLKEIEDCQKKVSKLEESSLEFMERQEKAEAALKEKDEALKKERERFAQSKADIEGRFAGEEEKLKLLYEKRKNAAPRISKPNAEYYKAMQKQYPDSAVATAKDGNCTGCRMKLPPQVYNNVRKGDSVVKCNNCRRILWYKEEQGA